ncbi:hypothetical protein ACQJBY_072099 [Aegilops geniculata]
MDDGSTMLTTCPSTITKYVQNLTSSYTNKSNESSVVATSVFMLVLAAVFFNLNLFSRVSNTSAVLNPTARLILSAALSLFFPVMNYLFSEAKSEGGASSSDLSVRARVILTWMLVVELLRKKVDAVLVTPGMQPGYAEIISHAAAVAWLGYLVFFNVKGPGRVAVFGTLWVLCAARFVQRLVITEIGNRSLAYGKNARLLTSYMAQLLHARRHGGGAVEDEVQAPPSPQDRLKACEYVVMGEENLVLKPGPHGYKLDLGKVATDDNVVTVGKIWTHADLETDHPLFRSNPRIRSQCLSFALFKLLRRTVEHLPAMSKEETEHCGDLIFQGICSGGVSKPQDSGEALFQVLKDEISFLSEYHHSIHPVVFASPYFFLVNYFLFPAVVCCLCLLTILLCGNGNMLDAYRSILTENYAISTGVFTLTKCLWRNFLLTPGVFFSTIDISITYLLFLAFIYEVLWEFLVFVFSNWFMVSLLCTYTAKPHMFQSPTYSGALHRISWANRMLGHPSLIAMKQFSVLGFSWLSMTLSSEPLPTHAKDSLMERFRLAADDRRRAPLTTGNHVLGTGTDMSWFCESESVAEVILTWHIATALLERKYPSETCSAMEVATRLSRYCAYLVAFNPGLLPEDREGTQLVYDDMKKALKEALGTWGYYLAPEKNRHKKVMEATPNKSLPDCRDATMNVVQKGTVLGKALMGDGKGDWELLASLWVELVAYIAPSSGDDHLKGQKEALVQGGELVTMLWALATHTGVTRPPPSEVAVTHVEDIEEGLRSSAA